MSRQLLVNKIKTPDGTILESRHRHDYQQHIDKVSGEIYIVDGGQDYLRRSVNNVPYEEMSIYDDAPFEIIREHYTWGTYGKDGKEKIKYIPLKDIDDEHLHNIISHLEMVGKFPSQTLILMLIELHYRGEEKNENR